MTIKALSRQGANNDVAVFARLLAVALVAPFVIYPVFLMNVLCFALFALAFNLLVGYTGLLSFGHAMFFGFAAYVSGYLTKIGGIRLPYWLGSWSWLPIPLPPLTPELAILAATAVAALLGLIAGAIAIRRQGIYFSMVTLALAQMVFFFCVQAKFTGGEDGIQAIRAVRCSASSTSVTTSSCITSCSPFSRPASSSSIAPSFLLGEVLKAIRENEPRVTSLGDATDRFKLIAFVLSAALAGCAGATKAIVFQLTPLTDVQWQMSGEVVLMTLVGGMGTVFGPDRRGRNHRGDAELPCRFRRVGADHPGRGVRRGRSFVPSRHRRRTALSHGPPSPRAFRPRPGIRDEQARLNLRKDIIRQAGSRPRI